VCARNRACVPCRRPLSTPRMPTPPMLHRCILSLATVQQIFCPLRTRHASCELRAVWTPACVHAAVRVRARLLCAHACASHPIPRAPALHPPPRPLPYPQTRNPSHQSLVPQPAISLVSPRKHRPDHAASAPNSARSTSSVSSTNWATSAFGGGSFSPGASREGAEGGGERAVGADSGG